MSRAATLFLSTALVAGFLAMLGPRQQDKTPSQNVAAASPAIDIQISKAQFKNYINEWSETEGFFDSDNFISNETSYLHVIDELQKEVRPGGIYIGVGPDQNFTYIAHTQPALAIIVDIRRQNLLEQLLYKALFELSASRAEFLSMLFSRKTPAIDQTADLASILQSVRSSPSTKDLFEANLAAVQNQLLKNDDLELSTDDLSKIEYVYSTLWHEGLDLRFSSIGRDNASQYPTYESLMLATDRVGELRNYLVAESSFQWMKRFQMENRLIPVVGDFAGSHAFRAVAKFLREKGLVVSTFYTSNVEFYLFGRPAWDAYMENVLAIPASVDAVFIRAYFSTYGRMHPENMPGHRSTTLVHDLTRFVADYKAGRISTYWDVVNR